MKAVAALLRRAQARCGRSRVACAAECEEVDSVCWICMEHAQAPNETGALTRPCRCPRMVHARCLARWQLQSAGGQEENQCRFCGERLPDWTTEMTPRRVKPSPTAVMEVVLRGRTHRVTVEPGRAGREKFEHEIREVFGLHDDDELEFTFDCSVPTAEQPKIVLEGKNSYDAAFHCASVSAAMRCNC